MFFADDSSEENFGVDSKTGIAWQIRSMVEFFPKGFNHFGWGNGYIGVKKDHPWFGKDYDSIECEVYGGLTYSDTKEDFWVVGFDSGHNGQENWDRERVLQETMSLLNQAKEIHKKRYSIIYHFLEFAKKVKKAYQYYKRL